MAYTRLPAHPILKSPIDKDSSSFKDDLLHCLLSSVFVNDSNIRTEEDFEKSLKENKPRLMTVGNELSKISLEIMTIVGEYQKLPLAG